MRKTLAAAGLLAAAVTAGPALAGPFTPYSLLATIAIPSAGGAVNPTGKFAAFDISFVDPTTGRDYVADRSNAAVDVFAGNEFLGRMGGFAGVKATTSISGPDGVVTVSNGSEHQLWAGDGGSLLKSYNISGLALPAPTLFPTINTGGAPFRVDEMAYSPVSNQVLVANNANSPAFGTLVDASTGKIAHGNIVIPGAAPTDGLEQPVWNPKTGSFFISVPQFGGVGAGGVAEIHTDGTVGRLYNFSTPALGSISACSPTGLAVNGAGDLLVGCSAVKSQTVLLDPTGTGKVLKTFTQVSGSDQIWYDPTSGNFFVPGLDPTGKNRIFDIINAVTDAILQTVSLPALGAHSISVDPNNGFAYVPLPAGNSVCELGCIAVYGVPEPGTMPVMLVALSALFGLAIRRGVGSP